MAPVDIDDEFCSFMTELGEKPPQKYSPKRAEALRSPSCVALRPSAHDRAVPLCTERERTCGKKGTGWEGMGIGCLSFAREGVDAVAGLGLQAKH